jgi:hypothetical protein
MVKKTTTDTIKAAALYMLRNGLASYQEIAQLSGRSRQVIRVWGKKVDAKAARKRYLRKIWIDARRSLR